MKSLLKITSILFLLSGALKAQTNQIETNVLKALGDFNAAIVENNSEVANNLLAEDALIMEGNGIETKEEYLSHHFHSDGRFLSAMNREILSQKVKTEGSVAWISTVSNMKGVYSEREIDIISLELVVFRKVGDYWEIVSIHWSSK